MRITVNTAEFKNGMEKVFKVVAAKSYVPRMKNILLTADESGLYISASNLEQFAKMRIDAETTAEGSFGFSDTKTLLKAMKFFAAHQTMLEYEPTERTEDGKVLRAGSVIIRCGGKKARQTTFEPDEFPSFPELDADILNQFEYSNKKLKERLATVGYAASTDDARPMILQGIYFKRADMVACDGFRLAVNTDESLQIENSFVTPPMAIKYVNEIMDEKLLFETDKKYIRITDKQNGATVVSRLLDGEYMDYSQYTEYHGKEAVEIDTRSYITALKYLDTFQKGKGVGVSWFDGNLGLKNSSGYFESEVNVRGIMPVEMCFNGRYMREALSQFGEEAKVYLEKETKPMILSDGANNNIAVVLPIRGEEKLFQKMA